jgi:heme A synthase
MSLLVVTLLVILWGAYVRVTGSGAGCADHWPLCNGELVPRAPRTETLIELTHRVTSALCGLLSIVLLVQAFRVYDRGSLVRRAALWGFVLMVVEGAIGALLVKKGLVAKDTSQARAFVVGLHLCNTFLLLGAQALTLRFARDPSPLRLRAQPLRTLLLLVLCALFLILGASGAITALGDTLFPAASLAEGIAQDLAPEAHFLVRLRVWHPVLAMVTGALVLYVAHELRASTGHVQVARWALRLSVLYVLQILAGFLNLFWLAPAPLQIVHLLLADLTWLALIFLAAEALAHGEPSSAADAPVLSTVR